jgi:hypothetical protein
MGARDTAKSVVDVLLVVEDPTNEAPYLPARGPGGPAKRSKLGVDAICLWNRSCTSPALAKLRAERCEVAQEDAERLSPLRHEHMNPLGRYPFAIAYERARLDQCATRTPPKADQPT